MKTRIILFLAASFTFFTNQMVAQAPKDFVEGSITLLNGTQQKGYIKDNMLKKGSIQFINAVDSKKMNYEGTELNALRFSATDYQCIKGDFFKSICSGNVSYLQKVSKTSTKVLYSGSEPVGVAGTDGKLGDFYLYKDNQLTHLTKKNMQTVLNSTIGDCAEAIAKAKNVGENTEALTEAILAYNNCTK